MKIALLTPDFSSNSLGRTLLLAEILARDFEVEIAGIQMGAEIWGPARECAVPMRIEKIVPNTRNYLKAMSRLAKTVDGEVLYAVKPRMGSFGTGLWAQRVLQRPLVLDIDDDEVSFAHRPRALNDGFFHDILDPNGHLALTLLRRWIPRANQLTVASSGFQEVHGGTWVPHAKDTSFLSPQHSGPDTFRSLIRSDGTPVIMFLGTPRPWKGLEDAEEAVMRMHNPATLVIVGAGESRIAKGGHVRYVPGCSLRELPGVLQAADIIVIPQRDTPQTARQLPSKLLDAMSMAKPIVATSVGDIPKILASGRGRVVPPGSPGALARGLDQMLDDPGSAERMGMAARQWCIKHASFAATQDVLRAVIQAARQGHTQCSVRAFPSEE